MLFRSALRDFVEIVQARIQPDKLSSDGVPLHTVLLFVRRTLPHVSGLRLLIDSSARTKTLPAPFLLNKVTRACLSMRYASMCELCLEGISPSRIGHLIYALPFLKRLKCCDMENNDGRPFLLPKRLYLSQIEVRHFYSGS